MPYPPAVRERHIGVMKRRQLKLDIDPINGVIPVSKAASTFSELVRQIRRERQPILVTHQGYGVAVLLDAETFKEMKELVDQALEQEFEEGSENST